MLQRIKDLEEEVENLKLEMRVSLDRAAKEKEQALRDAERERQTALDQAEKSKEMELKRIQLLLSGSQKQGYLWRQTKNPLGTVSWKKRYFVLKDNLFCCFKEEKHVGRKQPDRMLYVEECRLYELDEKTVDRKFAFQVDNEKIAINVAAPNLQEMKVSCCNVA